MALADVTAPVVKGLFMKMENEGASNAHISKCKTVLSALMQSAAEDANVTSVTHNPCRGIRVGGKRAERRKAITKDQFAKLLNEIPPHYRLFLRTRDPERHAYGHAGSGDARSNGPPVRRVPGGAGAGPADPRS